MDVARFARSVGVPRGTAGAPRRRRRECGGAAGKVPETSPRDETATPAPATTIPARGVTASRPRSTAKADAPELRHREGRGGAGLEVRRAGHFRSGGGGLVKGGGVRLLLKSSVIGE